MKKNTRTIKSNQIKSTKTLAVLLYCTLLVGAIVQTSLAYLPGQLSMISEAYAADIEGTDGNDDLDGTDEDDNIEGKGGDVNSLFCGFIRTRQYQSV